ncbi:MAG: acyltransferase domain-containing protein, partial [Myxococcales bacterium]|nr:acyltransferase domain-containing protein [Myxococcales bacterium]
MPGELANVIAGRVAAVFDLHGPNYVCDAACASAMAAMNAAVEGLAEGDFDAVVTGGIDANMSASTYTKFCKIGALSATGTRPYAEGADGFVMGEGGEILLLKRLADAERDGDRVYAVIRGIAGSSDGKGRGITAPNPAGQKLAVERAWARAGLAPATATLIEGHGTSTRVGDAVEVETLCAVFGGLGLPAGRIALGSVKSNIGHLKGAAGAAGVLKTAFALRDKVLPPSLGYERPNPAIDFARTPFRVNTALGPWDDTPDGVRRAGVSAFGFGGTNFHVVMEEHVPGRIAGERTVQGVVPADVGAPGPGPVASAAPTGRAPLRGVALLAGANVDEVVEQLRAVAARAQAGTAPPRVAPCPELLRCPVRLAIDHGDAAELAVKTGKALRAFDSGNAGMWRALRAQGIFLGRGRPGKLAFLFTGQGSQYANMLRALSLHEPIVGETFAEADRVMTPLLGGRSLTSLVFVDAKDPAELKKAEEALRDTTITQPAVLAVDVALHRVLSAYGLRPDMVMGHSLGEYGALVASGALAFGAALVAVSARSAEMARVAVGEQGAMAAVFGPIGEIERVLASVDGYAVVANINGPKQAVVGGTVAGIERAVEAFERAGLRSVPLSVSHAFHTKLVAQASAPLERVLAGLGLEPPRVPIISNVTGGFYPMAPDAVPQMIELLGKQIASAVQFVKGIETLYAAGARVFVETGPKRALAALVEEILDGRDDVLTLATNHPKSGDVVSLNHALAGLWAAGCGGAETPRSERLPEVGAPATAPAPRTPALRATHQAPAALAPPTASAPAPAGPALGALGDAAYRALGQVFADAMDRGLRTLGTGVAIASAPGAVVMGAGLGLPGGKRVFDDDNVRKLLDGEQLIDVLPVRVQNAIADKHVRRLVKSDDGARFETIDSVAGVIKLAGRGGELDLAAEFGVPPERLPAYDVTTKLAVGVALEALRDAGIPLAMHYKTTTVGTRLPERFMLPEALRDETGIIFGAAFPGHDTFAADMARYHAAHTRHERLAELASLRARLAGHATAEVLAEVDRRMRDLTVLLDKEPYTLDRLYVFMVLPMGHSQLAEYIGARGPNTHANAACASGTHAMTLAEDWIRLGRCRRVLVVTGDDVTSDNLMQWIGSGFLASGAAATEGVVEEVALPFDRRRHGLVLGMGAAGVVVESAEAAAERGVAPIAEVLGTITANSAFHGSRLDVDHIVQVLESMISEAERRHGLDRHAIAREMVFVSHETYTPARGGSAQAEVEALRRVFGRAAADIVIANTKGYTGHAMGAGMEDVAALKMLETGIVPRVANYKEVDPELGPLNLSRGGIYPVRYALRLGAGFGSQIAFSLVRWVPPPGGEHPAVPSLGFGYRIVDPERHRAWLRKLSGYDTPELEVVKRTLRIKDQGPPAERTAESAARAARVAAPTTTPARERVAPEPATPARAAEPVTPRPAAPAPAPAPGGDPVKAAVIEIVSKQTGYPPEMLDVELDLEADLGVDTVKQAETFAAVREAYAIEREAALKLKDFPTLAHVIRWVKDKRPDLASPPAATAPAATPVAPVAAPPAPAAAPAAVGWTPAPADDPVRAKVVEIVAQQTGYPPEMLDVELDLEA